MGDSTCVFQSFEHSSLQQGDSAVRALTESVSFGRFVTETLEWDKWSIFSQNRYLEEAKRFSKPGLVAQKKALLEAHFKKIAADKTAAAEAAFREIDASNLSTNFKPCVYMESVTFDKADAADGSLALDLSSLSGEVYIDDRIASAAEVCDFVRASNSGNAANFVEMDEPRSDLAIDKAEDLEVCDKMDALYDINKLNHTVVEPSSFQKYNNSDGMKPELDELDRCEVVNNSMMLLDDLKNKISVREPADQFVVASPGKYKPNVTCSKTVVSVKKLGVQSNTIPRPPAFPMRENNITRHTKAFGSAMLNKRKETPKSLHESINLKTTHLDLKRPLTPKKLDSAKSSASLRSSKERCGPSQVSTNIGSQKKQATTSGSLSAIMKSSAELYSRPAPSQLKKDKSIMPRDRASMQNISYMTKSKPKSLHMSINLDSHIAKKERLVSSPRSETKIDATSIRMSTTHSENAPANQVIQDSTMTRKKIIPIPNSSADVRKLITQFHGKPAPPLYKNRNCSIHSNRGLTSPLVDKMKSIPKSLHMSVDLSSTVGVLSNPALSQKRASYSVNALNVRSSRDCAIQGSRMESIQKASGMKDTEKCPPQKVDRPETPRSLIRPPSPTVSAPFRFRSDERAAKRNEILEKKCNFKSENFLEMKGKFPSSRPQSPYARKPTPSKTRETKNCKPQTPTGKAGLQQVTANRISTTITSLPRKSACEHASPNKV